jgi:hypothetical protein
MPIKKVEEKLIIPTKLSSSNQQTPDSLNERIEPSDKEEPQIFAHKISNNQPQIPIPIEN